MRMSKSLVVALCGIVAVGAVVYVARVRAEPPPPTQLEGPVPAAVGHATPPERPVATVTTRALTATVSTGGMRGLGEISVQAHVAGRAEWRDVVGLSQDDAQQILADYLQSVPGLRVVAASPETPRLMVQLVGHVIECDDGAGQACATHLTLSLHQRVRLLRPGISEEEAVIPATTWSRAVLMTGELPTMAQRVRDKLDHLLAQFQSDHARANPEVSEEVAE